MSNGRILQPGKASLDIQLIEAPLANPAPFMFPAPGGARLGIVGGLTKLEAAAIAIAATLRVDWDDELFARRAVDRAARVLDECARRSRPPAADDSQASG